MLELFQNLGLGFHVVFQFVNYSLPSWLGGFSVPVPMNIMLLPDRRAGRHAGRRAARHRHRRHRRDAVADHLRPAAGRRADHARRHLLRRAIWRLDHVDPGQYPGEATSVVTTLDGFQMAKQGRAGPALAIAAIGSFFAGCVATVLIAVLGAPLTKLALAFGPAEYFSLMVLGLIFAVVLAKGIGAEGDRDDRVRHRCCRWSAPTSRPAPRAWPSTFPNSPTASASPPSRWACSALPRSSAISTPARKWTAIWCSRRSPA